MICAVTRRCGGNTQPAPISSSERGCCFASRLSGRRERGGAAASPALTAGAASTHLSWIKWGIAPLWISGFSVKTLCAHMSSFANRPAAPVPGAPRRLAVVALSADSPAHLAQLCSPLHQACFQSRLSESFQTGFRADARVVTAALRIPSRRCRVQRSSAGLGPADVPLLVLSTYAYL